MEAHGSTLTAIATVVLAALACGMLMARLRQPALIGYMLAGVLLGPSLLALVPERGMVDRLAELGVLMLLFIIGMELSLRSFMTIWRIALACTALQIGGSLALTFGVGALLGWPHELALVIGFAVALSSTAVAIKMLEELGELRTRVGRITVGVLIAQDLAVVPMLLIVGNLAGEGFSGWTWVKLGLSVLLLAGIVVALSRRRKIRLPFAALTAGHADLAPVAGLTYCFGAAALSGLFGLSPAYGAFLAGLLVGNSQQRPEVMASVQPIQSVLLMAFFLLIGLLLDLGFIAANLGTVLLLLLIVTVFKTALNVAALRLLGQDWARAGLAGVSMAQVGEFSFLIAQVAVGDGLLSPFHHRLVMAVTVLSLIVSPFWLFTARRLHRLAARGVVSWRLLMRLLYAPERRRIAQISGHAARRAAGLYRRLNLRWRWSRRQRRQRAALAAVAIAPLPPTAEDRPGGGAGA